MVKLKLSIKLIAGETRGIIRDQRPDSWSNQNNEPSEPPTRWRLNRLLLLHFQKNFTAVDFYQCGYLD